MNENTKGVILKDCNNKEKTLIIVKPFIPDGTFWATIRIGKEVLPTVKLNNIEMTKLFKFLFEYNKNNQKINK